MKSYFVSFFVDGGYGNCQVDLKYPVKSKEDVNRMRSAIMRSRPDAKNVCIINFITLSDSNEEHIMDHIVYMTEFAKASLTTNSPVSSYGIPAMRVEGNRFEDAPDMGPSDLFSTGITAAQICCATYSLQDEETQKMSRQFCAQWPEGPQPT